MSNQSRGRKKSRFIADTAIPADAFFDFVINGSNRRLSIADMIAAFGTTGTLVQQGNVLGTPVLNKSGAVNNIRNLEDGFGVKASVSAENGITLDHNFTQNTDGAKPVVNLSVSQPVMRSFIAGTGMSIAEDGDRIQFSVVAAPTSTKTVVISQESDLPAVVSGRHPLADDTDYLFVNDIDTGLDGFLEGNNTVVRSADSSIVQLTYTGTDPMFKSVNDSNKITKIRLNSPNAELFEMTGATDYVFQFVDASVTACAGIGAISDFQAIQINNISFENNSVSGLDLAGTNGVMLMNGNLIIQAAGTTIDLGTATFTGLSIDTNFVGLASGATFLDGAASSANMAAGATGTVINTKNLTGVGTMLATISPDDDQWEFQLNDDIANTRADGLLSMQGNGTNTVIAVAGTPVLVAGTWVVERASQMTGTTAGRLTHDAIKAATQPITTSVTVVPVSGGTVDVSAEIAIDGTVVSGSKRTASAASGSPTSITIPWQEVLSTTTFVEVFVTNEDSTVNLLVSSAIHRVN